MKLARECYIYNIDQNEKTISDNTYTDEKYFIIPRQYPRNSIKHRTIKEILARHETVNRRFKQFGVLSQRFRHHISLHPYCFNAVANIVQVMIDSGENLFQL